MKKIIMSLFVLGIFASCGDAPSTENTTMETENTNNGEKEVRGKEGILSDHAKAIDEKLDSYRKEEKEIKRMETTKITMYYDGETLQKVSSYLARERENIIEDYYLKDGILHYAKTVNEGTNEGGMDIIDHYFFDENGDMIKRIDASEKELGPGDDKFEAQVGVVPANFQRLVDAN